MGCILPQRSGSKSGEQPEPASFFEMPDDEVFAIPPKPGACDIARAGENTARAPAASGDLRRLLSG